ncbi:MAG: hypothetical protein KatS3mg002_1083 [Candidatus Woesearchaeota archaeon]|nr:MAG: hypothetical protein KatS3mg002_1083 [Candidatus Woesearchaeota archaeon]
MDDLMISKKAEKILENLENIESKAEKIAYLIGEIYLIMLIILQDK